MPRVRASWMTRGGRTGARAISWILPFLVLASPALAQTDALPPVLAGPIIVFTRAPQRLYLSPAWGCLLMMRKQDRTDEPTT